jgi:hypothetical protein
MDKIVFVIGFLLIMLAGFTCGYLMLSMLKILYELAQMQLIVP